MDKAKILSGTQWDTTTYDDQLWGTVTIRALSAGERIDMAKEYEAESLTNERAAEFYCMLIARSVINDDHTPVFDRNGDLQSLQRNCSFPTLERIAGAILEFNGMADAGGETKKN